jgi:hypothetical protein
MSGERWVLCPEVAAELGDNTVMDVSVHPPKVSHLHLRFIGWLGDELLETFPCFLVSSRLARALEEARLSGFSLGDVEVSVSPEFQERQPGCVLPEFRWLKLTGDNRHADFGLSADLRLEVSSRALEVLRRFNIADTDVEAAEGP